MTLVYGMATKDIGFLVADTLITFEHELKNDPIGPVNGKHHALKIHILTENIAIAFAGYVAPAMDLIGQLSLRLRESPLLDPAQFLFDALIKASSRESQSCEFLVLQLKPSGKILTKVLVTGTSRIQRGYIGNQADYQELRKKQEIWIPPKFQSVQQADGSFVSKPYVATDGEIEFQEISLAMEHLVGSRASRATGTVIPSSVTRVVNALISGNLEYMQVGEVSNSPTEGSSGFSLLASNRDVRGMGLYFKAGQLGFVFVAGDREFCHRLNAATLTDFIHLASKLHHLHLEGATWSD